MPSEKTRVYWDSCVFLSYINGYPGRVATIDAILAGVRKSRGKADIVTSTMSITEVAFAITEQTKSILDPAIEAKIDSFWQDRSVLRLIEFHEGIARRAREMMRLSISRGWSLKSKDAVHLASAEAVGGISEFHTYDTGLFKYGDGVLVPFTCCEPHTIQFELEFGPNK